MAKKSEKLQQINKLRAAYQVCHDCGTRYGEIRNCASSVWNGECDVCGETKAVTEARDYGFLWKGIRELEEETPVKDKKPTYVARVQQIEITRSDEFTTQFTTVKVDDEGGGPFLAIAGDVGEITLDFEEFDEVVKAVQILREQFRE